MLRTPYRRNVIYELAKPIPVTIVAEEMPNGIDPDNRRGYCIAWERVSIDWHLLWLVVLDGGGQVVNVPNKYVRVDPNWTAGRRG